jgi:hypothetical protein
MNRGTMTPGSDVRAWLGGDVAGEVAGDVGDSQLDIRLMRDGTQIPHRDLIDNMTRGAGQRRSRVAFCQIDAPIRGRRSGPADPWPPIRAPTAPPAARGAERNRGGVDVRGVTLGAER